MAPQVVTLFLALAAVQFVVSGELPATGYVLPTQQAAVCTYVLLGLIAAESIVVSMWVGARAQGPAGREGRGKQLCECGWECW